MTSIGGNVEWGDALMAEETLPPKEEYGPDENGIKTIVEYKWAGEGSKKKKEKVITKMKRVTQETRIPKAAQERAKTLQPFGKAAEDNKGVTYQSFEEVRIEKPGEESDDAMQAKLESTLKNAFWRRAQKQHHQKLMEQAGMDPNAVDTEQTEVDLSGGNTFGKYVPPSKRGAGAAAGAQAEQETEEETTTLRISNLSPEASEDDVRDLCKPFGSIQRIRIATDRETGESRGYGFVTFHLKSDAERAKSKLDGYGYDHLILKVDWARQRKRDPGMEGALSGGFVSGYGKALPQMPGMGAKK
eukprot:gb/GECG01000965.1/.p1 GENE.gb/GECG01000965.1/~~gb/GECG01000965.1/.p1  ORF type:complete len:301 (+),score=55.93 gb/GECG01000965.1/:1-903(+)